MVWYRPFSAQLRDDGTYDPSPFTLTFFTEKTTKYSPQLYETKYTGDKPILVVCTDEGAMQMENDRIFNTGNHPVETLVPMLHFRDAGFTFDIATSSGKPVVFEMWAYPNKDEEVKSMSASIKKMLESPKKISDIKNLDAYSAVFIPGGHGAMINLPFNADLGRLLHEAHAKLLPTVTLCHGPAALLSTQAKGTGTEFAYKGYESMCYTDRTDAINPWVGYLPGKMPWNCQNAIEKEGLTIVNKIETGAVKVHKELIAGDSPTAAHNLGVIAAPILVKHANANKQSNKQRQVVS